MKKGIRDVLKKRAEMLTMELTPVVSVSDIVDVSSFTLADETYGIESIFIKEVCALKDYTPLPGLPSFILGIINVRGQIVAVVNLKKFFNLPEKGISELNKVVIINNANNEFGILADIVDGSFPFDMRSLKELPPQVNDRGSSYIKGIGTNNLILLDAEKILSDRDLTIDEQIKK